MGASRGTPGRPAGALGPHCGHGPMGHPTVVFFNPPQRGIAILGVCRIPMPPDFPRTAPPAHTWLRVIPTEGVCGSPRGSVWIPHKGLLLLHNSTMVSFHSTKDRPEPSKNTISAAHGVATPPWGALEGPGARGPGPAAAAAAAGPAAVKSGPGPAAVKSGPAAVKSGPAASKSGPAGPRLPSEKSAAAMLAERTLIVVPEA